MPTCSQLCAHTLTSVQQQAIHTLSHAGIAQYSSRLLTAMPRISQLWLNLIIYLPRIASTADAAKLSHNTHEMAFIRSTPKGKNLAGPPGHSPVFQVLGAGAHRIHIMAWGKRVQCTYMCTRHAVHTHMCCTQNCTQRSRGH